MPGSVILQRCSGTDCGLCPSIAQAGLCSLLRKRGEGIAEQGIEGGAVAGCGRRRPRRARRRRAGIPGSPAPTEHLPRRGWPQAGWARRRSLPACRAAPAPCARRSSCRCPGMRVRRATSLPRMALTMSGVGMPLRMVIASFGPMPLTEISFSKSCFSSARRKPKRAMASSRTWVWMKSATSRPAAGSSENVGTLMVTS